jgi:hypothetical protein
MVRGKKGEERIRIIIIIIRNGPKTILVSQALFGRLNNNYSHIMVRTR